MPELKLFYRATLHGAGLATAGAAALNREGASPGTRIDDADGRLVVDW